MNDKIRSLIHDNDISYAEDKSVRTIFLNDDVIKLETFRNKKSLLFEGVNITFEELFFKECILSGSCFREASSFKHCTFIDCNLSKVFYEGVISNCVFVNCDLFEAEFVGITIINSLFVRCDFSSFYLSSSTIRGTDFLMNSNFNEDCINNNVEDSVVWN
jgi:uncharacterized protein YjbI with pentapeptide repeats